MKRVTMFGTVAALAMTMVLAVASRGWAQQVIANLAGGTITGTVVDADGKAVSGAEVRLIAPPVKNKVPKDKLAAGDKKEAPAAIKTAQTDADGKFSMTDVPAGDYMVGTKVKDVGVAKAKITVEEGKEATVTLKLAPKPAKKPAN